MARYLGSVCKLCRNEGTKLFLKGSRCETPKCAIERRAYGSGQHGQARKKLSEYALQLREKQKIRRLYTVQEKQFRRYYTKAVHMKGVTGTILLQFLEHRLDNIVFRSGLVPSRAQARQLIRHGFFKINGKKVDIPSVQVRIGDVITAKDASKVAFLKALIENVATPPAPEWQEVDRENVAIKIIRKAERDDMDKNLKEALVVEYYSR